MQGTFLHPYACSTNPVKPTRPSVWLNRPLLIVLYTTDSASTTPSAGSGVCWWSAAAAAVLGAVSLVRISVCAVAVPLMLVILSRVARLEQMQAM